MSTTVRPPLDFTTVREDWSRYDLADNSILKVKIILTRVRKLDANYKVDFQNVSLVLTNEIGTPDPIVYSNEELVAAITQDVRYTTTSQDWNEYVADDGARIRIQPMVMRVARTSKYNSEGQPTYWVETQGIIQVRPPNPQA